ncbi:putative reverse transcriptase domain-containing protein [Tanacetum coccineum]
MDFITKLPRTKSGHDTIWVIVDKLTKSAHFLAMREDYSIERTASHTIQLGDMLRACVIDFGGNGCSRRPLAELVSCNNIVIMRHSVAPFKALYEGIAVTPDSMAEIGKEFDWPDTVKDDHLKSVKGLALSYRLRLPEELSEVHDTFHVSNLKKCLADANLHVPLDEIKIDKTLHFVKEPVEIMDREVKTLKRSKIPIVKVRWNSKRGPDF